MGASDAADATRPAHRNRPRGARLRRGARTQIVNLKVHDEVNEQRRWREQHPGIVHLPETTCLELAEGILSEVVGRLQAARETD